MELSGMVWKRVITLNNPTGRAFSGTLGDGVLAIDGVADVSDWYLAGTGLRGA